jgi:tRNA pseudouridine38-40 synthase
LEPLQSTLLPPDRNLKTSEAAHRSIACIVAYDGTLYRGSQRQSNGRSIQGELERALQIVLKHEAPIALAGRTDAGVHALGQCFRFATNNAIPAERVPLALNRVLERDVRVLSGREVHETFHPRFSAKARVYRYRIEDAAIANPLLRTIAGRVEAKLDVEPMRAAGKAFLGRHDFAAWQSAGSPAKSTVKTVKRLTMRRVRAYESSLIEVTIEADAFLYQMVRNIVGALIVAGKGELTTKDISRLTLGLDRTQCPPPAPPPGLCLVQVKY